MAEKRLSKKANSVETNIAFEFETKGDTLIVKLAGEADLVGSSKLRQALVRRLDGIHNIVFDLSELNFADSYFLRLLIKLRKRLGGVSSVKLINTRPNIKRILELTGLDKVFL